LKARTHLRTHQLGRLRAAFFSAPPHVVQAVLEKAPSSAAGALWAPSVGPLRRRISSGRQRAVQVPCRRPRGRLSRRDPSQTVSSPTRRSSSSAALASCTRLPSSKWPEVSGSVAGALAMGLPTPGSTPLGFNKHLDTVGEVARLNGSRAAHGRRPVPEGTACGLSAASHRLRQRYPSENKTARMNDPLPCRRSMRAVRTADVEGDVLEE